MKVNKRRLCFICRRELTVRHYVKDEWLEDLKNHCEGLEMWHKIMPGKTEICCSHFESHSHSTNARNASRYTPLILRKEFCRPGYLPKSHPPTSIIKESEIREKRSYSIISEGNNLEMKPQSSASILRDVRLRHSTESQTSMSITGMDSPALSVLYHHLRDKSLPLSSLEIQLDTLDAVSDCQVSIKDIKPLLQILLKRHEDEKKLSFENFKSGKRKDLYFWTGIEHSETIESFFIKPLLELYLDETRDKRRISHSTVLVQDRVLWLLIHMWDSQPLRQLYHFLSESGSYNRSYENFKEMLKVTADHLAEAVLPLISLPSIEEWSRQSSEEYATGMDLFPQELMIIIDGTSLPIKTPENERIRTQMWVTYKHHHAWRYLVAVLPNGRIVFVSELQEGKILDSDQYNRSGLRDLLRNTYPSESCPSGWKFCLVGDKGYIYIVPPPGWDLLLTKSGELELRESRDGQTSAPDSGDPALGGSFIRRFDMSIAPVRSVVERSISLIKRWPRISQASGSFKAGDRMLTSMVLIAAAYANHLIETTWHK